MQIFMNLYINICVFRKNVVPLYSILCEQYEQADSSFGYS